MGGTRKRICRDIAAPVPPLRPGRAGTTQLGEASRQLSQAPRLMLRRSIVAVRGSFPCSAYVAVRPPPGCLLIAKFLYRQDADISRTITDWELVAGWCRQVVRLKTEQDKIPPTPEVRFPYPHTRREGVVQAIFLDVPYVVDSIWSRWEFETNRLGVLNVEDDGAFEPRTLARTPFALLFAVLLIFFCFGPTLDSLCAATNGTFVSVIRALLGALAIVGAYAFANWFFRGGERRLNK